MRGLHMLDTQRDQKMRVSLRKGLAGNGQTLTFNSMTSGLGMSLVTVCALSFGADGASAQEADVIVLPTVDVETSAAPETAPRQASAPRTVVRTRQPAQAAPQPQVCTPELSGTPICSEEDAAAAAIATAQAKARAGSSPYADPDAPFKGDRSANSRLPGDILDTPRSVTAITQEVLETTGTTSVRELARTTPGISLGFGEGGNAFGDNLYIRGFKANNDIYADGIRDPGVSIHETFNTEQVDVIKGPSGTVGGRGTTGGALDVATKLPQDVAFRKFSTTISDAGVKRQTFDLNVVPDERTQLRFNGLVQDGAVAGRDNVEDDRLGLAAALRYKVTDAVTLEAALSHTRIEQTPDWGVPYVAGDGGPVTEFGVDRSTFYGVVGRDFQIVTQSVGTVRAIWEMGNGMTLTNTLRGSSSLNDYVLTAPSSLNTNSSDDINDWTTGLSFKSVNQETDVLADVLELSGDAVFGGLRHAYVLGFSHSDERVRTRSYSNLVSEDYLPPTGQRGCTVSVVNPDPVAEGCWTGEAPVLGTGVTNTQIKTTSLYAIDTVAISPKWAVNAGLRVDFYDITRQAAADPLTRDDVMLNWNLGATYKPMETLTLYGAAATSTNPMGQEIAAGGGFYGGLDTGGIGLKPEQNTSVELGAKYEHNGSLLLTAALFRTTKDNAREDIGPRGATVTSDTLKYHVQGLELGLAGKVTDRIGLFGGATLMRSEILASADATAVGKSVANIAETQFSLLGTYDLTDKSMMGLRANYTGARDLGGTYANGNTLPAAWTVDLVGEYEVADNASLRLNVTNLTDKVTYDAAYRSGTPFTYVAPGREISLSLNMQF